jgi:hypothetical protein
LTLSPGEASTYTVTTTFTGATATGTTGFDAVQHPEGDLPGSGADDP